MGSTQMESTFFIATLAGAAALAALMLLVVALWRHKRAASGEVKLLGELGRVETKLDPEGTVIVAGELWRARTNTGEAIDANARVRVVAMQGHLVVVDLSDPAA